MSSRLKRILLVGLMIWTAGGGGAAGAADAPPVDAAPALSWRLDAISTTLLGPAQPSSAWRRSAALLDAAARLDPAEPRFPRLQVLAMLHLNDVDGAIAAMRTYRKLAPADRQAQAQLIDLYAGKMETVDAKVGYLRGLIDKQDISVEVRSHVASECAALLLQKSRPEAAEMAKRAVELYPLPEAAKQYYELVARDQPVKERVHGLLAVLLANPNEPAYLYELATVLANTGMPDEALQGYAGALAVIMRSGPSRPPDFHNLLIDFASEQVIAGHGPAADTFLGKMLDELPRDPDAWFLKLTVSKSSSEQVTYGQTLDLAKNALVGRWNSIHDEILNGPAATQPAVAASGTPTQAAPASDVQAPATAPAKVEPLDSAPVVQKLKNSNNAEGRNAVIGALSDLAWFEVYYDNQPAAAKQWIDALAALNAEPDLLARLAGWEALQSGMVRQARESFAKIAATDALARLGLIRADQADKKPIDQEAVRKLLAEHRVGLLGAIIWDALRSEKITPATQPSVEGLSAELKAFPSAWLTLTDPRAVRHVYEVQVEPVASSVAIGDPMLFGVTVTNNSENDIPISADGLLRPGLWFDGQILGIDRKAFHGVAFDQIGGELVLRPQGSASQTVRLDVGELRSALLSLPAASTRVSGTAITNPLVLSEGVVPSPGGLSAPFARTCVQVGIALGTPAGRKVFDAELASNSPLDRLHALDFMAACIRLAGREGAEDALKKLAVELSGDVAKLRSDSSPAVRAWASYLAATTGPAPQAASIAGEMSKSGEWTARLLSLYVGSENQKELATALATDADPTVRSAAEATMEMSNMAATQPATQAASRPSGGR